MSYDILANERTFSQFLKLEPTEHLQFLCSVLWKMFCWGNAVSTLHELAIDLQRKIRLNAPSLAITKGQGQYWTLASRLLNIYFLSLCYVSKCTWVREHLLYILAYRSWAHRFSTMVQVLWKVLIYWLFWVIPNKEMFIRIHYFEIYFHWQGPK